MKTFLWSLIFLKVPCKVGKTETISICSYNLIIFHIKNRNIHITWKKSIFKLGSLMFTCQNTLKLCQSVALFLLLFKVSFAWLPPFNAFGCPQWTTYGIFVDILICFSAVVLILSYFYLTSDSSIWRNFREVASVRLVPPEKSLRSNKYSHFMFVCLFPGARCELRSKVSQTARCLAHCSLQFWWTDQFFVYDGKSLLIFLFDF